MTAAGEPAGQGLGWPGLAARSSPTCTYLLVQVVQSCNLRQAGRPCGPARPRQGKHPHALPDRACLFFSSILLLTLQIDSLVLDSSRSPPCLSFHKYLHPVHAEFSAVFIFCCMIHFQPPPQPSCLAVPPPPLIHGLITAIHRGQGPDIIPQSSPAINNSTWFVRGICAAIFTAHNCCQCGVTKRLTQRARVSQTSDRTAQQISGIYFTYQLKAVKGSTGNSWKREAP